MKGILFKTWKTKAIADSSPEFEWQTRRLMPQFTLPPEAGKPYLSGGFLSVISNIKEFHGWAWITDEKGRKIKPRYQVGEVVYIKEAWHFLNIPENKATPYDFGVEYADGEIRWWTDNNGEYNYPLDEKKRSPMFIPERFARYFIKITAVRAERLQEITEGDAKKEGIIPSKQRYFRESNIEQYARLWDSINPKHPWSNNDRVWVYRFKKVNHKEK